MECDCKDTRVEKPKAEKPFVDLQREELVTAVTYMLESVRYSSPGISTIPIALVDLLYVLAYGSSKSETDKAMATFLDRRSKEKFHERRR